MDRTVTIKGYSKMTVTPNFTSLFLTITTNRKKHAQTAEDAAKKFNQLQSELIDIGFKQDCIKTASYELRAVYVYNPNKAPVQDGFRCVHKLRVEFDYDADLLSKAISVVSSCLANPQIDISFSVKNIDAMKINLLSDAAKNAKAKAEALCVAAGAQLGKLLNINHNFNEHSFNLMENTGPLPVPCAQTAPLGRYEKPVPMPSLDLTPKDFELSESAIFTWQID